MHYVLAPFKQVFKQFRIWANFFLYSMGGFCIRARDDLNARGTSSIGQQQGSWCLVYGLYWDRSGLTTSTDHPSNGVIGSYHQDPLRLPLKVHFGGRRAIGTLRLIVVEGPLILNKWHF